MKEVPLSDWTLVAFKQREEERRRKEQDEADRVSPIEEMQSNKEMLRSDGTIAALQKRFTAIEQRLAALEQRDEERRRKEQDELAHATPQEKKQCGNEASFINSILSTPKQRDEERNMKGPPELAAEAKVEHGLVEAMRPVYQQRERAETIPNLERKQLQRDRIDTRLANNGEAIRVGRAPGVMRGLFSVLITASIAGAIGFGIGMYEVPKEKAADFRALVKRGLDAIYGGQLSGDKP